MATVRVTEKFEVVIPPKVRAKVGLRPGDVFEASAENGKITLTRLEDSDAAIAEGLSDIAEGRVYGPFETAEEMIASMNDRSKKPPAGEKPRSR